MLLLVSSFTIFSSHYFLSFYFVFEKRFTSYTFFNVSQTMTNLKVFVILRNVLIGLHETGGDYLEQTITNRYLIFCRKNMTNR